MKDFESIQDVMPKTLALIDEDVKRKVDEHKIFFIRYKCFLFVSYYESSKE